MSSDAVPVIGVMGVVAGHRLSGSADGPVCLAKSSVSALVPWTRAGFQDAQPGPCSEGERGMWTIFERDAANICI